jgi:acyl carrier protein
MTKTEARRKIKEVMSATFSLDADSIDENTTQKNTKKWSSLNHLRLVTNLEKELGLKFAMKEIEQLTSYNSIEEMVLSKMQ